MKFTITRTSKLNLQYVSTKTVERFIERIAKDDAKQSVANSTLMSSIRFRHRCSRGSSKISFSCPR